jgi:hypothetical protein
VVAVVCSWWSPFVGDLLLTLRRRGDRVVGRSTCPCLQPLAIGANREASETAEISENRCRGLRPVADRKRYRKAGVEGSTVSSPSEGSKDVIPICLTAVSSGDDDAAAAVEVFRGRLQEERGHARA